MCLIDRCPYAPLEGYLFCEAHLRTYHLIDRKGKCPYCTAHYSTSPELARHLDNVAGHVRDRLATAENVVAAARGYVNAGTEKVAKYRRINLDNALRAHERMWPAIPVEP